MCTPEATDSDVSASQAEDLPSCVKLGIEPVSARLWQMLRGFPPWLLPAGVRNCEPCLRVELIFDLACRAPQSNPRATTLVRSEANFVFADSCLAFFRIVLTHGSYSFEVAVFAEIQRVLSAWRVTRSELEARRHYGPVAAIS